MTPDEHRFAIPLSDGGTVSAVLNSDQAASDGDDLLILAHGAGQDMDSAFMQAVSNSLTAPGRAVLRFNFHYMEVARETGRRRPPDRAPRLEQCWREVAEHAQRLLNPARLLLGGKSMGGRMASRIVADGYSCDGLLFLGYPLHPPGKPDKLRSEHLTSITCPMLFIQGSRDSLCRLELLRPVLKRLSSPTSLHVIDGGDHSLKLLKRLKRSEDEVYAEVKQVFEAWLSQIPTAGLLPSEDCQQTG